MRKGTMGTGRQKHKTVTRKLRGIEGYKSFPDILFERGFKIIKGRVTDLKREPIPEGDRTVEKVALES